MKMAIAGSTLNCQTRSTEEMALYVMLLGAEVGASQPWEIPFSIFAFFKNFVRKFFLIIFEKRVLFLFYAAIQNHLTAPFTALCESQL
jgi:hypothetical protein